MDDPNLIRQQMEQTRGALSEKIEILENRVSATMQEATHEVAETVQAVTGSVQETVEAVTETVHTVKETVDDTLTVVKEGVGAIRDVFDIPSPVTPYPWLAVSGSVAVGFFLGDFLYRRKSMPSKIPARQTTFTAAGILPNGQSKMDGEATRSKETLLSKITPELKQLAGLAVGALMGTVREMVTSSASDELKAPLAEVIDNITEKIGGTRIAPKAAYGESTRKTHPHDLPVADPDLECCHTG
jgi:ElaB/YqjD/DUF883 family membrane-anchored ribosome-binding protein